MGIEVGKTGIDWVDQQLKAELDNLKASKFDKDKSIRHLNTVKNAKSYNDMMKSNPAVTIMAVQILLKELGYTSIGKIDGILRTKGQATSRTMEAIKDFQRKNKLTPDGAPGPDTVKKLLEKFGSSASNTPKPKTPEKQAQNAEATLADLKNFNPYSVGNFDKNKNFVFKKLVEKSDSKGTYILVNGKKLYELGNNESGVRYNKFKAKDGSWTAIAFGEYKNGSPNGRGKEVYSDGDKYAGELKNGSWEGKGIYYFKSGDKYAGDFKNSLCEGKGTYYYKNGDKYVGEYKNDDVWTGIKYAKDGKTVLEKWVNGKKVQ